MALLEQLLDTWLAPLRAMNPAGDPVSEILTYVRRKLDLSRVKPLRWYYPVAGLTEAEVCWR